MSTKAKPRGLVRRLLQAVSALVAALVAIVLASAGWVAYATAGKVYDVDDAPDAPVAIVLGAQVRDGKPMRFLAGRLDAAIALMQTGKIKAILVSGDADGNSGNEIQAMTDYLIEHGIDPAVIIGDDHGIDTYDTCARAKETFGVERGLIISQPLHVSRAVALCEDMGLEVDGVTAECIDCNTLAVVRNYARELLARPKAVLDLWSGRDPVVVSPPVDSLAIITGK
ncbi:SanA/YdcF family protein [Rhodococcoides yunnanense]|uniref:ElyC/SanA/YdcF family protein n=1 Tax=Rhodococcoides yunnanense TaxID=278209 RepID=A0ABU4BKW5_9NOCA|nr:ElyC/SanA/YdcF family protein [Rhodococcus yunnanensis]MDV6264862.1 ElyC/SanA/YdcF family protein [Rhodococcus yunnanensis]